MGFLGAGRVLQDVIRPTSPGAAARILRFQAMSVADVPMQSGHCATSAPAPVGLGADFDPRALASRSLGGESLSRSRSRRVRSGSQAKCCENLRGTGFARIPRILRGTKE